MPYAVIVVSHSLSIILVLLPRLMCYAVIAVSLSLSLSLTLSLSNIVVTLPRLMCYAVIVLSLSLSLYHSCPSPSDYVLCCHCCLSLSFLSLSLSL